MVDPQVYLEKITVFSAMLRREGLSVTPAETADACKILIELGMDDRKLVKTALRTVYAKTREEQIQFDHVFDSFFISEEAMRRQAEEHMKQEQEMAQRRMEADRDLESMGFDDAQRDAYAAMAQEQKQRLLDIKDRYKDGTDRSPNLYGNFIHSVFAKAILEQQMMMEDAGSGVAEADPELGLLYRDITKFKDSEIPKAITIIQDISRRINGELSAKKRNASRSAKLDFRKTIRKGLETGGSFYRLKYRKKRAKKKHLVLLCDVSGSMMQFSEFALRFIQSLNQASESSRTFIFSESIHEADSFNLQNMDMFRNYVRECGIYGRGTDLGSALDALNTMKPCPLNDSTTLLILSDTKTIDQRRAMDALIKAKQLCGRVIWLNPIPESRWPYIRSVQAMASICNMISCNTLNALAQACKRLTE